MAQRNSTGVARANAQRAIAQLRTAKETLPVLESIVSYYEGKDARSKFEFAAQLRDDGVYELITDAQLVTEPKKRAQVAYMALRVRSCRNN